MHVRLDLTHKFNIRLQDPRGREVAEILEVDHVLVMQIQ